MVDFNELQNRVFTLYGERRYREALDAVRSAFAEFPERASRTSFWIACLLSRLGETDRALQELQEAMRDGIWWAPEKLRTDADLEPLWGRDEFREIVGDCGRRREAARARGRPRYRFIPRAGMAAARGTVVAFHERGGNREETVEQWASVASAGFNLAAIQSSQAFDMEGFCWDDLTRSEREIHRVIRAIQSRHPSGTTRLTVAGFSQGAGLAIHLALSGQLRACNGVIAIVPTMWPWTSEAEAAVAGGDASRDLKVWLLTGERDAGRPFAERLCGTLLRNGLACRFEARPGMGHALPPDFPTLVKRACDFFSGRSA